MLISVVIPTYNGRGLLAECLPSVFAAAGQCRGDEVEVIVVDDASTDGTAQWCRRTWPSVTLVALLHNKGFAHAANAGLHAARGAWIALLNNDTVVDRVWLAAARLPARSERTAAVACRILRHGDPTRVESAGDGYTMAGLAYQRSNGSQNGDAGPARTAPHAFSPAKKAGRTFSACAAAAFYRREALDQIGGFEERFESYYEDVDLSFRLHLLGWRIEYEPTSLCHHRVGATYGPERWKRLKNSARNSEIVFFSCMPARLLFRALPAHAAVVAAQALARLLRGRLAPFLAGKLAFLGCLRWVMRRRRGLQEGRRCSIRDLEGLIDRDWFAIHILKVAAGPDFVGPQPADAPRNRPPKSSPFPSHLPGMS